MERDFAALLYHRRRPCANPGGSVQLNKQRAIRVKTLIASQRAGAKAPPDDRLREAIRNARQGLDCFVASLLAMTREQFHG
jgi:hypothetical protein